MYFLKFKVKIPGLIPPNAVMAITGNTEETGYWEPQNCKIMQSHSKTADE